MLVVNPTCVPPDPSTACSNGFFWTDKGFEYPLMWGIVALAFVILGGGRYSIDALIGREF